MWMFPLHMICIENPLVQKEIQTAISCSCCRGDKHLFVLIVRSKFSFILKTIIHGLPFGFKNICFLKMTKSQKVFWTLGHVHRNEPNFGFFISQLVYQMNYESWFVFHKRVENCLFQCLVFCLFWFWDKTLVGADQNKQKMWGKKIHNSYI